MIVIILLIILVFLVAVKFGSAEGPPDSYYMGEMWFNWTKSGEKTVDVRPGQKGKYDSIKGKEITYRNKDNTVKVKVTSINHYETWDDLLAKEDLKKIAPGKTKEEFLKIMSNYYEPANTGGINAIHFDSPKKGSKAKPKKTKPKSKPKNKK
jgi:ASC-1-like (ASCH) protein